jgi:lysozyme
VTLREQLIRDEGRRLRPYRDSVGKLTIGVGRNLDDVGISPAEADFLLDNDIARATAEVRTFLPWTETLDEVRREALVNMAFNLGIGGLLGFRLMLAALRGGDYASAAAEVLESRYAQQVGPRAHRVSKQIETGERQ